MKSCVVLQGPLYQNCMDNLCKTVATTPNCIVSTWTSEDPVFIQQLRDAGAIEVIQSEKPLFAGAQNFNYMTFSTTVGVNRAEELGFTHVLRFRTDFKISDFNKFMGICESMDPEKLVFMCWFNFHHHQYLIDYFTFGPVHLVRQYYSARRPEGDDQFDHDKCNERILQETFFGKKPVKFEDTYSKCDFIIKKAIESSVEIYCIKSSPNTNDIFKEFMANASYSVQ